jgi:serine/threonine protein kinase/Tol biopolymer transport system component
MLILVDTDTLCRRHKHPAYNPYDMSLPSGTKLDGYEILDLLGSGGMGQVYRARDAVLKREVAIKILASVVSTGHDQLQRFEREAQAAAALNHPNILAIHRFGVFEDKPYLVSELLVGDTLRQLLERGPLSVRKTIDIGVQIADGLAAAHEMDIVHRDLKPENLFIIKDNRVKILDFGLAKLIQPRSDGFGPTVSHMTDPGTVMGTVGYMSPEQVKGQPIDHRADIFALGAILYEMLAGKRPFQRSTAVETMTAILNDDPSYSAQIPQTTPPGLQQVVRRCLEKNPQQRFQSASDLAFALESLSESGISSGIAIAPGRRRSRTALTWLIGLVAILALLPGAYFTFISQNRDAHLRVSEYAQLTHDGHAGQVLGTDGSRLYLELGANSPIMQMADTGGEMEPVAITVPKPWLDDVSPDGSTFLIESYEKGITLTRPLWSVRILGGSRRYLADSAVAAWTPDGKSLGYFTLDGDLHIIPADGTGAPKVLKVGVVPETFKWSPDGKIIRYSKDYKFWEISSNGNNLRPFLADWHPADWKCCGIWSHDGDYFFFVEKSQIWALDERREFFRRRSKEPIQLTSGPVQWGSLILSKDGKKIFANGSTTRGELSRLDAKSGHFQPFLGGISAEFVAFSKDGKSVAYVSFPDEILWKANIDGSERVQLTESTLEPGFPHWSPDGSRILFSDLHSQFDQMAYTVPSQGGKPERLLPDDSTSDADSNWSPDGTKIVFSSCLRGHRDSNVTIKILDVVSRQVSTVPGSVGMFSPHWSPDGHSIVSENFTDADLNIFDFKTQRWSTIYRGPLAFPIWSSDSRFIYFYRWAGGAAILRIPASGGTAETVVDLKDFHQTGALGIYFGLDPSDTPIILRDAGTSDIYALTLQRE